MAVVSTVAAVDLNKFLGTMQPGSGTMAAGREIVEEPMARAIEEKIYVALGREVDKNKSVLVWALHNSGGKRICIIHVHQQARMIPLLGGKFPASSLKQEQVQAYREIEKQDMHKILDQYLHICLRTGVRAEKLFIEMDSIERGILELVSQHGIKKLVMGGAADKHYPKYKHHKKMMDLRSKKANTVREQAPTDCHIWFICKGYLFHTREGASVGSETMASSSSMSPSQSPQREGLNSSRSQSVTHPLTDHVNPSDFTRDSLRRVRYADYDGVEERPSSPFILDGTEGSSTPGSRLDGELLLDEWVGSRRNPSQVSSLISFSPSRMIDLALVPFSEGSRNGLGSCALSQLNEHLQQSSPPSVLEGSVDETMYDQLEQAMADAANLRREAFEEALRRAKAEKDAIEAIRRVKAAELLYSEEQKHRKEIEETLKKEKEGLVKVKSQCDLTMEELRVASHQQLLLKDKVAESEQVVKELEEKIISAVELLQTYKKERDELEMERDKALKEAEELRRSKAEASSSIHVRQFFTEFSFSDIEEATQNFDPSLKIGEGGYGSIYKGLIRHTQVAIKMLQPSSMQGPSEFQQEVDVLSKMRHPNLVTLIGACPESWTLVYEYLPNGSLEDRLTCLDNSPPLSWQTRIRIAAELCCVLIFLHSSKPHSIVHGDLKPSNILLDKNFVSKLSDFGICRLLARDGSLSGNTVCCRTDPKGTFVYMDPEFLSTGELSPKSDVYSFGIILLRLLTGRPALGISKEVQHALDTGKLKNLLDPLAGDWPFVQAEQLARLALRCCEMNRRSRPDLETEVWRVLEPMRASCGSSSSFRLGSEEHLQPPSYYMCPIFQEIMQDPHIAADGFTYEAEALRGWLDSGHDTSPMTNLKLDHCNLVPNHALRSAIQEWLQQH